MATNKCPAVPLGNLFHFINLCRQYEIIFRKTVHRVGEKFNVGVAPAKI
jgi:hypothetical protein